MKPTQTVLTNELKLQDFRGVKLSVTFGDADIVDGYSFARLNFNATDDKIDMWTDKTTFNIISENLTLNDRKVWSESCQGPNSGMNSDMLDGLHATDFKDRAGAHHYAHMFYTSGGKKFIKLATFTTRKVGAAPDFNVNGTPPYEGIFVGDKAQRVLASLAVKDKIKEFKDNTVNDLRAANDSIFHTTNMLTEGVFNGTLRASVSLLKLGEPTTIDVHLGLFEDPMNTIEDGWNGLYKYFYVSLHDNQLPFLEEDYPLSAGTDPNASLDALIESSRLLVDVVSGKKPEDIQESIGKMRTRQKKKAQVEKKARASVTVPENNHGHDRPYEDRLDYETPPDPTKDYVRPAPFPPPAHVGSSYGQYLDIMRLYHIDTHVDTVDGIKVITHKFDLYLSIDEKSEVHLQPYMSSSCSFYNFEKPVSESELPQHTNFLRPKSIYDDRYAHKKHRHYDLEEKIWHLVEEVDEIWDAFDHHVVISQGDSNANKVLMTDERGDIFCAVDNLERHRDKRRIGRRVMVTDIAQCISESSITIDELAQLEGIEANVQGQLDELKKLLSELETVVNNLGDVIEGMDLGAIWEQIQAIWGEIHPIKSDITEIKAELGNFVRKTGDTMTGDLYMNNPNRDGRIYYQGNQRSAYIYGGTAHTHIGCWDDSNDRGVWHYRAEEGGFAVDTDFMFVKNAKFTISSGAPANPKQGDVWIKT